MKARATGWKRMLLGVTVAAGSLTVAAEVQAKAHLHQADAARQAVSFSAHASITHAFAHAPAGAVQPGAKRVRIGGHGRKSAYLASVSVAPEDGSSYGRYLQCVAFARANSGIELAGNAALWWAAAQGIYERGSRPEIGSVLNFRANGRMHAGHVAVVTNVDSPRRVEIDHANWGGPGGARGGVSRNVTVVDVSPTNDWSAVRVALGRSNEFGSVYPTYGFIYDRPDHGLILANNATAPMPALANPPPRDLRPAFERLDATAGDTMAGDEPVEVAEATVGGGYRHGSRYAGRHGLIHQVKASHPLPGRHAHKHARS